MRKLAFQLLQKRHAKLMHKSDVGGVKVGIKDEEDLKCAFDEIVENVKFHKPEMVLDGILIEGMAQKGLELVVGASRDIDWGPVTLVGLGGIWIEALGDVCKLAFSSRKSVRKTSRPTPRWRNNRDTAAYIQFFGLTKHKNSNT